VRFIAVKSAIFCQFFVGMTLIHKYFDKDLDEIIICSPRYNRRFFLKPRLIAQTLAILMTWVFCQKVHCNLTIFMIHKLMNVHENENQRLNRVSRLF
jgi:hypothetical protein